MSLALLIFDAQASYIDLSSGEAIAKAQCTHHEKVFTCLLVFHNDLVFVVLLDQKGEYEIYLVDEKESTLIWARNSI